MTYVSSLAALADPTRRAVFERLRDGGHSVGDIARGLPVSRPAVSQHLKVLKEAGLVREEPRGTRRIYASIRTGLAAFAAGWTSSGRAPSTRSRRKRKDPQARKTPNDHDDHHRASAQDPHREGSQAHAFDIFTAGSTAGGRRAMASAARCREVGDRTERGRALDYTGTRMAAKIRRPDAGMGAVEAVGLQLGINATWKPDHGRIGSGGDFVRKARHDTRRT